jgi:hypothetical protein
MDEAQRKALSELVSKMSPSEVKDVFAHMRTVDGTHTILPKHGLTVGEFAVAYVMNLPGKPSKKRSTAAVHTT